MDPNIRPMAFSATLHCLAGCSIGEIAGLIIGTWLGLGNGLTIVLAITLAFLTGYLLSTYALLKHDLTFKQAFRIVLAADTLSILVMEIVDNFVMFMVPGAMDAGLGNILFWATMAASLAVAFVAALPVNYYLLKRGKGHALVHKYQEHQRSF